MRLKAAADLLDGLCAQEEKPTEYHLSRKITSLKTVWDDFGKAHEALFAVVDEGEADDELEVYNDQLKIFTDALNKSEDLEGTYGKPDSTPPTLEEQVGDLLQRRTDSVAGAEEIQKGIFGVLADTKTATSQASLRTQLQMLEEVKQVLGEAAMMTTDRAAEHRASGHARELEVQKRIQEARNLAATLGASSPQQSGTRDEKFGGQDLNFSQASQYLYEKRPFPQFNGKKRNFPSFRREWTETVTGRYSSEFDLREIRRCTPRAIQPDIKNLKTVNEVWEFLEQEYGQLLELT